MSVNKDKRVKKIKKSSGIQQKVWNSLLASYNVYAKKYGYNGAEWTEYFLSKEYRSQSTRNTQKWCRNNRQYLANILEAISSYYERQSNCKQVASEWSNYKEYLDSGIWKSKRNKLVADSNGCPICSSKNGLIVHHLRYYDDNGRSILGREGAEDLIVMCWDCHKYMHEKYGRGASFGIEEISAEKALREFGFEDPKDRTFKVSLREGLEVVLSNESRELLTKAINRGDDFIHFNDASINIKSIILVDEIT